MATDRYSADDPVVELGDVSSVESATVFELRSPRIPKAAVPVFDEHEGQILGYRHESAGGVYKLYDLDGELIGIEELPLEAPLFDPIDLLFFAGGVFRIIGKGAVGGVGRVGARVAASRAAGITTRALAATIVGAMRTTFRALAVRNLKFTATTAARMSAKGRHVPLHILELGIRYGKRSIDPQGVKGAALYSVEMLKNGKKYILEIVVREADWTILHFLYK